MSKLGGMGNCFPFIRKHQKGNKEVTLAILGIDNAGKTTTAKSIKGDSLEGIGPTVGFDKIEFCIGKFNINLFDLGGGKNIRAIWKSYLSEVFGLIYVIDSSDSARMEEARDNLQELFANPKVQEKPVLLLANKQDKECALEEGEIVEVLNLVNLVYENRIPCRLERCAAMLGSGKKLDKPIKSGLRWLLGYVDANMAALQARIDADMEAQRREDEEERQRKRERVRRNREEREREQEARGERPAEAEEEAEPEGDPFKPLDVEELRRKEAAEKEKKKAASAAPDTPTASEPSPDIRRSSLGREGSLPPPVLAGSTIRGQFYSPRGGIGSEDTTDASRPPSHLGPLKPANRLDPLEPGNRLEPLTPSSDGEAGRKKKKKKRARLGRKNKLAPDPLGGADGDDSNAESEEGASGMSRTPSRPDLFVTEQIYTLDELDEDDSARRVGPNGDNDLALR